MQSSTKSRHLKNKSKAVRTNVLTAYFFLYSEKSVKGTLSLPFRSALGQLGTNKNCIVTDNLDVIPADTDILLSAEKTEAFRSAPYNYSNKTSVTGIDFNITYLTHTAAVFRIDYLFVTKVGNTTVHKKSPHCILFSEVIIFDYINSRRSVIFSISALTPGFPSPLP